MAALIFTCLTISGVALLIQSDSFIVRVDLTILIKCSNAINDLREVSRTKAYHS